MAGTALIIGSVKFIAGAAAFASRRWNYRHLAFRQRRIKKLHAYRSLNRTPDAPVHDSAAQGNRWRSGEYPVFPPRLVKVLSQDSLHGSRNQELTLEAISRLFKYNAARTSIGSWQNALWQNFLEQAVRDPFAVKGERALVAALGVFETLPDLESLNRLSRKFGYLEPEISTQDFRREASAVRRSAQQMDRGRFAESDIEAAIGHARYSPHGRLLFKRLKSVLEGRDTAAKIRELVRDETIPTETFLEDNRRRNLIGDELAATIAGGVHTAYLDDPRLARKVVAVYEEILPYLKNPLLREKNLTKIRRDFFRVGAMHPEMSSKAFVKFLSWQADSQAQAMSLAIQRGRLEIATLPGETFDDYVRENNLPSGCKLSLFLKPRSPGYANLIWLRAMPTPLSTRNPETAFHEFISRMIALFHEGEHYRHFTGEFDPRESLSKPFDIRALDREGRLVTESMAFLEQLRWGIQNVDDDYYQVGRRLGENLAQVARGMADFGYFGESISWK